MDFCHLSLKLSDIGGSHNLVAVTMQENVHAFQPCFPLLMIY